VELNTHPLLAPRWRKD